MADRLARQPTPHRAPSPRLRSARRFFGLTIILAGASFGLADLSCETAGTCQSPVPVQEAAASPGAGIYPLR